VAQHHPPSGEQGGANQHGPHQRPLQQPTLAKFKGGEHRLGTEAAASLP
jgi:hypothetical protein